MNCSDCTAKLQDYVDRELTAAEMREIDVHVGHCANCRAALGSLQALLVAAKNLPSEIAPSPDLWRAISSEVERLDLKPLVSSFTEIEPSDLGSRSTGSGHASRSTLRLLAPLAIAASVALLLTVVERNFAPPDRAWSVATLAGAPQIDAHAIAHETQFQLGQWLETDAASRAKVSVGSIGEVKVEPNSRLRLAGIGATDHRLELARGTMHALIWAPPRLFFVDTPSATAVDLGCAYTLTVADDGDGELRVTTGYVALEHDGREAIIPAHAMCLTRRGAGPGTPFAEDAPPSLRAALQRFDFEKNSTDTTSTLREILVAARPDDAITLWHLLARTSATSRAAVYDTLAKLTPPPSDVTREGILAGDVAMRRAWGAALGLGSFAQK